LSVPQSQSKARTSDSPSPLPAETDDYRLMQGVARADPGALRALYDRYSPTALAVARRIVGDAHEAEQLLVDVFWELWQRPDRYDANRGCPLTYLMTLTRSRAIDRRRSMTSRDARSVPAAPGPDPPATDGSPLDTALLAERRAQVRRALQDLDPQHRQAIECAYFDCLTHTQIAQRLNKPLGTIKTHIRQGLARLREKL
jgi:RNA polymerase sigma-70 factor (ECF subfamily)